MTTVSSIFVSLLLVAGSCVAAPASGDDGQWHPSGQGVTTTTTAAAVISASPKATLTQTLAATGDWSTIVTWPAGCESWSNPCPPGAPIVGGGVAGGAHASTGKPQGTASTAPYENGFTSYTTLTNSDGVITGMPPKATVPAGVSASTLVTSAKAAGNFSATSSSPRSSTQSGFSISTASSRPLSSSGASRNAAGGAALFVALGLVFSWL